MKGFGRVTKRKSTENKMTNANIMEEQGEIERERETNREKK